MALYQPAGAKLPATIAEYDSTRRELMETNYWIRGTTDEAAGEAFRRHDRAHKALASVLRRKGGSWVVGDLQYTLTDHGITVEQTPGSHPFVPDVPVAA